jgi:hypothetical protein
MAVLENRPSKTLGFLHVFSSENHFFNTLLGNVFGGPPKTAREPRALPIATSFFRLNCKSAEKHDSNLETQSA